MKVPQQYVAGLVEAARLSSEDMTVIMSAVNDPELHTIDQTAEQLATRIKFDAGLIARVLEATMSLANVRADQGSSIPDFIEDLLRSMNSDSRSQLHLSPAEQAQFATNIAALLADEALVVASKTIYLKRDYEHTYCRARIVTDIRPVFGEDRTKAPTTAIISHLLQLTYHEGQSTKQIHVAMEGDDLSALKLQIERAIEKSQSLKKLLAGAKVAVVSD
jgi:hypothetical protein